MDPLVSTEWLAAELGSSDLVVLDATLYPPGDPRDARNAFVGRAHSRARAASIST